MHQFYIRRSVVLLLTLTGLLVIGASTTSATRLLSPLPTLTDAVAPKRPGLRRALRPLGRDAA